MIQRLEAFIGPLHQRLARWPGLFMTHQPQGASPRFPGFVELDAPLQEPDASAWWLMNHPGWHLVHVVLVAMSIAWTSGCERSTPADEEAALPSAANVADRVPKSAEDRSAAAEQALRRVTARYRSAKSYRDRAVVRMTYRVGDEVQRDSAPLSVHYVAPDRLTMGAYSTHLEWRGDTLRAFVEAPEVNRLDRQLLQCCFKNPTIEVAKLYRDPVFAHFATAGPGGPAPQIELLFGEEPLAGFFADEMRLDLGEPGVIDGRPCRRLLIEAEGSTYVLWVDRDEALIRKIELPAIELPRMQADVAETGEDPPQEPSAGVALSIDFIDAEIDGPGEPLADRLPRSDMVTVNRLILPPPPLASPLLGRKAEPFRLKCRVNFSPNDETFEVTGRGSDRQHTILLWVANHSGSELAIERLAAFADQLPSEVRATSRFVVVQAETLRNSAGREATHASSLGWAIDEEAIGRDRFGIEEAPALCVLDARGTVHWLQSPVGPEMAATLDGLLRDLYAGVNVGSTLREQYEADVATYRQALADSR